MSFKGYKLDQIRRIFKKISDAIDIKWGGIASSPLQQIPLGPNLRERFHKSKWKFQGMILTWNKSKGKNRSWEKKGHP